MKIKLIRHAGSKKKKTDSNRRNMLFLGVLMSVMILIAGCSSGETSAKNISDMRTKNENFEQLPKEEADGQQKENAVQLPKGESERQQEENAGQPSKEDPDQVQEKEEQKISDVKGNAVAQENNTEKQHDIERESEQMKGNNGNKVIKFSQGGALHVEKTQLMGSDGTPIQLRGISTHGLSWFPGYVNQEFFLELSNEWNVNVIRLAMYTAENGGYCTDGNKKELKQLVKDGIDYATQADLYVIVDWHILSDGNPNTYKEEARQFFKEISEEFADHENIIYEICNEPNGNVSWTDIKAYAEEIIPVIRANDADAVIIVGTPTWSQDVDKAAADPIAGYDNLMYTLHFYAATHTDWLRDRMVEALNAGLPVFVSEFGICDASGGGGIDYEQSDAWIKKLNEYGVSYVAWNLSNKGETSAIFQSGCNKTSDFTTEDLSENGQWIYEMLTGKVEKTADTAEEEKVFSSTGQETEYTADISNSWEAEGKCFYQYQVTLKNVSDKEISDWKLTLTFNEAIQLSDGWNGDYTEKEKVLEITAKDYNGKVAAGGEVTDIGFIVSGSEGLKLIGN